MPNIILRIKNQTDKIIKNEKISCYCLSDNLPKIMFDEAIATNKMVLVEGEQALLMCKKYNIDGVIKEIDVSKPLKSQIKPLRDSLKNKTLGVVVPARRHEAMLAGEVEPEFIAFYSCDKNNDEDIISWYNELFLIPLVWVCDSASDKDKIRNVDFIIVSAENF